MIKWDDLRRGNRVRSKTHKLDFAAVESILPSGIVLLQSVSKYDYIDKIEPIKVTSGLLKRYGFTENDAKYHNGKYYYIQIGNQLYLEIDVNDFETRIVPETWRGEGTCSTWRNLEYFHEVQNAYYDLTGEHLIP
jgi:hypothetical protein